MPRWTAGGTLSGASLCYIVIYARAFANWQIPSLIMAHSPSSVPAAPAVASFSACCQPVSAEARCPRRHARRWLHAVLAIGLLGSMCCVSAAQGTWSTARLSVARSGPAATSVGNVAIFAGGYTSNCIFTLFVEGLLFGLTSVGDAVTFRV